jgi:hypothetical protein
MEKSFYNLKCKNSILSRKKVRIKAKKIPSRNSGRD